LSLTTWAEKRPSPLKILPKASPPDTKKDSAVKTVPQTTTRPSQQTEVIPGSKKHDVSFIINQMELGNFHDELTFEKQELIIDQILLDCAFYATTVPRTFKQAQKSVSWVNWQAAIKEELDNLAAMKVWSIRKVPTGRRPLKGRWVFAEKTNDEGEVIRFKARYVAKGFTQVIGLDYESTFAPTATFVSMRLILTMAAKFNWEVYSFDFVAAYLNAPIDEEVWVEAPEGLDVKPGEAMLLHKALYGTKQAARCWWLHLKNVLESLGFEVSQYDNSLYTVKHKEHRGVVWVHVDDGIVTGSSRKLIKALKDGLKGLLKIKWSDGLNSIVGLEVKRSDKGFSLRQPKLINQILNAHWDGQFTHKTPLPTSLELITDPCGDKSKSTEYLSIIGSLSYLAVGSRPDIAFAVNLLARFSAQPGTNHWKGLRHLIGYLADSRDLSLNLFPDDLPKPLKCFCDASWGGEFAKSTYGVIVTFFGCPVLWTSRRFATIAASTCQAEYMALGVGTRQVLWVRHLVTDILKQSFTGALHCDNQAAIWVSTDDSANKRVRHVEREYYLTNQALHEKKTELMWVPTK
jgi:hypothetical protein